NVLSSGFVLLALLSESTMLHSRLVLSVAAREQERESRRTAMDVAVASIAHELRQPLAAIVANGKAGEVLAVARPTEVEELRATFSDIGASAMRAGKIIESIRSMFAASPHARASIDANDLVRDAVSMMRIELETHDVAVHVDLAPDVPSIHGHR